MVLQFKKPEDDGGKPIANYVVEKRDKKTGVWEKVSDCVPSSPVTIKGLKEGHEYDFRVMAENQNGVSEPLQTEEPVLAKNPFDPPGAPGAPECANRGKDVIEIAWKPPKKDGGAPIQGYNVERKERGDKGKWVKINRDLVREPLYQDTKVFFFVRLLLMGFLKNENFVALNFRFLNLYFCYWSVINLYLNELECISLFIDNKR